MKKNVMKLSIVILCFSSCKVISTRDNQEKWKQEILKTEEDFERLVKLKGTHHAFVAFADENAALIRSNKIIVGKKAIDSLYKKSDFKNLSWKADFVEISKAGDLGFTYGKYTIVYKDSTGNTKNETGVFSTIWKRQHDGTWKFILD